MRLLVIIYMTKKYEIFKNIKPFILKKELISKRKHKERGIMKEKDILQQAIMELKEGREQGFNTIYAQTYNYVFQRACFFMKNEEEALDVVQDVYVAVYKSIHTLEDSSKLYAWMGGITYNLAMRAFRKKKEILLDEDKENIFENIELEDISLKPEEKVQADATAQIIKEILEELPELQRAAVFAFYYDNMSIKEIAEQFECSENTIKSRLNYARKFLKEAVTEREKKEGYRLHSFGIPTLLLALYLYGKEHRLTKTAAQTAYNKVCTKVGVEPTGITSVNEGSAITDEIYQSKLYEMTNSSVISNSSAVAEGGKAAGAMKTGGLTLGARIAIGVAAAVAVVGTIVGVVHYQAKEKQEPIAQEEQEIKEVKPVEEEPESTNSDDTTDDISAEEKQIIEASETSPITNPNLVNGEEATYTVETVSVEHPNGIFEYPQIRGWENEEKQTYWNDIFRIEQVAEEDLGQTYEVKTANENYLSIMIKGSFQGGVHPYSYKQVYNINMQTGEIINLTDCVDIAECAKLLADDNSYVCENPDVDMAYIMEFNSMYYDANAEYEQQIQSVIQQNIIELYEGMENVNDSMWYIQDNQVSFVFYVAHADGDYVDFTLKK